jgi:hypothetical protein
MLRLCNKVEQHLINMLISEEISARRRNICNLTFAGLSFLNLCRRIPRRFGPSKPLSKRSFPRILGLPSIFNDTFEGLSAFEASFNIPFRRFWAFQASFNNTFRGVWAFQASLIDHTFRKFFGAPQASFINDAFRRFWPFGLESRPGFALSQPLREHSGAFGL